MTAINKPSTNIKSNVNAPTQFVEAGDNRYACRRFGTGSAQPLLFLQHFTGTLDNCDFEGKGAGRHPVRQRRGGPIKRQSPSHGRSMATHASSFLDALGLMTCDVLGYSLDGIAQQMVQDRPSIFRKMILVATAPRGGEAIMHLEKPSLAVSPQ